MISTRTLVLTAAAVTLLVGLQARLVPYLPGDIAIAQAFQAMAPGTSWVAPMVRTASAPGKFILMVIALLGAWRLAGPRALLVVAAAIVLEQTFAESSKLLFGRPRPSRELVAVMGNPTGLSFPVDVHDALQRDHRRPGGAGVANEGPRRIRTAVLVGGSVVLVVAAAARIVPGAHWPSDAFGTAAILMTWLAVAFADAGAERR